MQPLRKIHKSALSAALLLWSALAIQGCSHGTSTPTTSNATEVRVAKPVRGEVVSSFVASGRVQAKVVRLAAGEKGRLQSLQVKLGQSVRKGQILARLDDSEQRARMRVLEADLQAAAYRRSEASESLASKRNQLQIEVARAEAQRGEAFSRYREVAVGSGKEIVNKARASLKQADVRYDQAQKEFARQKKLFEQDIVSVATLEKYQSQVTLAAAQRDEARAELRRAELTPRRETLTVASSAVRRADVEVQAAQTSTGDVGVMEARQQTADAEMEKIRGEIDSARLALNRTNVLSPCDGIVSQVLMEPGELVTSEAPILAIQKNDHLWIEAELDEQDSSQVKLGQPVDVTFSTRPGKTFQGKVEELAPALEQRANSPGDSKVLRVRVVLQEKVPDLRVGLHADVQGRQPVATNVLNVPNSAVVTKGGQTFVFSVNQGTLRKLPVVVGERTAEQTVVRQGLQDDTVIVVEGADGLAEGASVKVRQ